MRRGSLVREFAVSERIRVEVVGGASDVSLFAHGEGKVRVEMAYEAHGWGGMAEARERALLEGPPLSFAGGVLRVGPEPEGVTMDYALWLPAEAEVEVEVGSGDVSARGLSRRLRVSTGSGDVSLRDVSGEVRIRCGSGDIELSRVFGALSFHTGSGDIEGENVKGDVDLETGSGDIALKGVEGELRILTGSGDVRVEGKLKEETWRIRTGSGDVHLELPEDTEAEILLHTDFGDIDCEFVVSAEKIREGQLVGRLGQAPRARLQVKTGTGDITISKR